MPNDFLSKVRDASLVYTFRDLLLLPGRSKAEPSEIDLACRLSSRITLKAPIVSSPMDTVTEWRLALEMARLGGVGVVHRNMSIEEQVTQLKKVKSSRVETLSSDPKGRPLVGAAVSPLDSKRCLAVDRVADFIVSDVAHFHNSRVIAASAKLLPELSCDFVAGNVGTAKAAEDALNELPRVDGFRAGIGSGSVCTTTEVTRVGAPTVYAVAGVASAVSRAGLRVPVVADGGIGGPGDAALALAAGASAVMLGSLLAGTAESPSKVVLRGGRRMKIHRGMASAAARRERFALDRYSVPAKGLEEGIEAYVPYTGKSADVVARMTNGLSAALGYAGASSIEDLWQVASFGLISPSAADNLVRHPASSGVR